MPYPLALVKPTETATTNAGRPKRKYANERGKGQTPKYTKLAFKKGWSKQRDRQSYPSPSTRSVCGWCGCADDQWQPCRTAKLLSAPSRKKRGRRSAGELLPEHKPPVGAQKEDRKDCKMKNMCQLCRFIPKHSQSRAFERGFKRLEDCLTLLRAWVCPTRMRALEHMIERQKLIRMTERSERMYLRSGKGRGKDSSELGRDQSAQ